LNEIHGAWLTTAWKRVIKKVLIWMNIHDFGAHSVLVSSAIHPAGHGTHTEPFSDETSPGKHSVQNIPS
jgi:hypothetical protein